MEKQILLRLIELAAMYGIEELRRRVLEDQNTYIDINELERRFQRPEHYFNRD